MTMKCGKGNQIVESVYDVGNGRRCVTSLGTPGGSSRGSELVAGFTDQAVNEQTKPSNKMVTGCCNSHN